MSKNKLAYLELPSTNTDTLKRFYGSLFGWSFQDFGNDYAAFPHSEAGLDGGFNADSQSKPKAPLAIIESDDLEAMQEQVCTAGGAITLPIFSYPGGRRFHFTDPSGNELAVMQVER